MCTAPPDHERPGFVEVEDERGHSMRYGEWVEHDQSERASTAQDWVQS